jgi:hypothetical protein
VPGAAELTPVESHHVTFTDGCVHELDFASQILGRGGVFIPLQDVGFFRQVRVDPESGTIVCPNGVDFCPDVLYSLATGRPIDELDPGN